MYFNLHSLHSIACVYRQSCLPIQFIICGESFLYNGNSDEQPSNGVGCVCVRSSSYLYDLAFVVTFKCRTYMEEVEGR